MGEKDWASVLRHSEVDLSAIDGHFIVMRWFSDRVELLTDTAGVRTLYCRPWHQGVFFSTRLDWLASLTRPLEVDYVNFGSQWILPNSINTEAVVKQVHRLGSHAKAIVNKGKLQVKSKPWTCTVTESDKTGLNFERTLQEAMSLEGAYPWSLGLSGGLDSRVLCAIGDHSSFHIWGPSDHPDVQVSSRLATDQKMDQKYFQDPMPDVDQCIDLLRQRVGFTQVITPASASIERSAYGQLHAAGQGVIDGGFGEVIRRQLLNQVVFKRMLCRDSPHVSLDIPTTGKAAFFTGEIHNLMTVSAKKQFNSAWRSLPSTMTIADKADVLSIRSRLPNFFGFEQNYLDTVCVSYMPYAQPSVLRALFQVPLRLRWNGRLLRGMIRKHAPSLSKYPLVKGTVIYPFGLGTLGSYAYTLVKKRLMPSYQDPRPEAFIRHMQEYILDTLRSSSVRDYAPYDQAKLQQMADSLASGNLRYTPQLDWWLTFDMWRKSLSVDNRL